jgi:hypothetical protein
MNTPINTKCFNFGYDSEGLRRANTYSNKKGYTAMGGTTDPNVILNLQNGEVDVVVLNGNRSDQSTWAVYIPMKKHLESMGIVCEMDIESYNYLNNTTMEAQKSIQQEASVDPIASASQEGAVIPQETIENVDSNDNGENETPVDTTQPVEGEGTKDASAEDEPLKRETEVFDEELERIIADPRYHAAKTPSGRVALDLTAAHKDGIAIVGIEYNRKHGRDQNVTGKSLVEDGAQHPLIVIPVKVALEANIPVARFSYDPHKDDSIGDDALAVMDGHGRVNSALTCDEVKWPQLDAVLPVKNKSNQIDTKKQFKIINENVSKWGGEDYIIPRLFDPSDLRTKLFKHIHELQEKGYKFTAACEWSTFNIGNISKTTINKVATKEEAEKLMNNMEYAERVRQACASKFGEGDDNLLKTTKFPETVIEIWNDLVRKNGTEEATKTMVEFINSIQPGKAIEITGAKRNKDKDLDKDTVRKQLFKAAYKEFNKTKKS